MADEMRWNAVDRRAMVMATRIRQALLLALFGSKGM